MEKLIFKYSFIVDDRDSSSMPAGVTWRRYLTFGTAAMFSMFLGSHTVHQIYRPLDDLPDLINDAKENKHVPETSQKLPMNPK